MAISIVLGSLVILASGGAAALNSPSTHQPILRSGGIAAMDTGNATGTAELEESIVRVQQGETTRIRVQLSSVDTATVVVGEEEQNVTITATDGNGDESVSLEFHTDAVGMERTRFEPAEDEDDYATLNAGLDPGETVPLGDYPISVYAGHGVDGEPTDVGTLAVTEVVPPPNASISGGSTVRLHPDSGQAIDGTTELASGRDVSVRLRSSGGVQFLMTREVSIEDDGHFSASFDLSGLEAPANATATVSVDGRQIAGPTDVRIVEESSAPGQPGFGVVLAIVAVLGTVVLRRRSRY